RTAELKGFSPVLHNPAGGGVGPGKSSLESFRCSRRTDSYVSQFIFQAWNTGQGFAEVIVGARDNSESVQHRLMLALIQTYIVHENTKEPDGRLIETFDVVSENYKLETSRSPRGAAAG